MGLIERELKFEIAVEHLAELKAHGLLRRAKRGERKRQRSIYFDADDDAIWHSGATLRVRTENGRTVQTVKSLGSGGAPIQRHEDEHDIEGETPDLELAIEAGLDLLRKRKMRERLAPRFQVDVERETWSLIEGNAEIELALDQGRVSNGDATNSFCEVELELKHGAASNLYETARQLAADLPLTLNFCSKAERGYLLCRAELNKARKAQKVVLESEASAADALRTIAGECVKQILLNVRQLHAASPSDSLHQARVGVRRLRAAFSFFKRLADDEETNLLKRRWKRISDLLGEARDLDVMKAEVGEAPKAERRAQQALTEIVERRRCAAYRRLRETLGSARFRCMLIDLAEWLDAGEWLHPATRDANCEKSIGSFAAQEFDRRLRKLAKKAVRLDEIDDRSRHRIRIGAKKLRYDIEFLGDAFPSHNAERFRDRLKEMQAALGDRDDRLRARNFLVDLQKETNGGNPAALFAAGEIVRDLDRSDNDALLRSALKSSRKLAGLTPFWR
jgi:inorganic triphosphatase YgiF